MVSVMIVVALLASGVVVAREAWQDQLVFNERR